MHFRNATYWKIRHFVSGCQIERCYHCGKRKMKRNMLTVWYIGTSITMRHCSNECRDATNKIIKETNRIPHPRSSVE